MTLHSQEEKAVPEMSFEQHEMALMGLLSDIVSQPDEEFRKQMNYGFIPRLVKALKKPNSFNYPFENLASISKVYAPDSTFRILTWAIPEGDKNVGILGNDTGMMPSDALSDDQNFRYYGAIQMNTDSLKLFPLIDRSDKIPNQEDVTVDNENWIGCVYYNLVVTEFQNHRYYNLFGWDGKSQMSDRKIVDVMQFESGKPVFGAPIFEVRKDTVLAVKNRFILEYKENSGVSVNYSPDINAIVYDYIAPQTVESKGAFGTYIPDGTYDGLIFENGMWNYYNKIYDQLGISQDVYLSGNPLEEMAKYRRDQNAKKKGRKKGTSGKRLNPWDK